MNVEELVVLTPEQTAARQDTEEASIAMPDYVGLGQQIGLLVQQKQIAYGDSFSKAGSIMSILYPGGIPAEKLDDALTMVRVLDKLFRIATAKDAFGESPWQDICGYALLSTARANRKRAGL